MDKKATEPFEFGKVALALVGILVLVLLLLEKISSSVDLRFFDVLKNLSFGGLGIGSAIGISLLLREFIQFIARLNGPGEIKMPESGE